MDPQLTMQTNPPYQSQYNHYTSHNINNSNQLLAKKRIGQYSYYPTHLIGSGYSSNVYKCKKRNDKSTTLAIKVIRTANMSKANFDMLQNQIKILKQLNHPNIIQFHDVYYTKHNCYIVTDYCEGGTLQNHIQSDAHLNWQEICQQVVSACKYIGDKLIIHRDIKPANIFQKQGKWKLGDFGFARFVPSKSSHVKQTYTVGSPLYMPPETLQKNIYSLKTDSFALGILLFHLVTGQFPWSGNNKKQLLDNYAHKVYPAYKITHLQQSAQEFLKGLCQIEINRRLYIDDYSNSKIKIERKISSDSSLETTQQATNFQRQLNSSLDLNIAQKFKLCRFLSFIDLNIQHFPQMCQISQSLRRNIKYFLIVFGWDHKSPQAKYMEEFRCKNYLQFENLEELIEFRNNLYMQIQALDDTLIQRCQVVRIKLIQYVNILENIINKNYSVIGSQINNLILNPDFSRVSINKQPTLRISRRMYTSHF